MPQCTPTKLNNKKNGKIRPVETILRMGGERDKGERWRE
jgi:hypothetical protein